MFFQIIGTFTITDYLLIIFLTFLSYLFSFYYNYFTRPNPLPGPIPLPFELEIFIYGSNFKHIATTLYQKYGDICEIRFGGHRRIILSKTEYFENLLSTSSKSSSLFGKHEHTQGMDELGIFGRGIFFNSNYDTWKINRYLFSQAISTLGFNNEAIKRTNESFDELVEYWNLLSNSRLSSNDSNSNSSNNDWFEIDFLPWIKKFTSDIISVLTTGEKAYSMASYYNTCNSIDYIENSCRDDPTLNNSDKFIQGIISLIKGMIIFQIFNPFLRHHLPLIKDKANNVLENRDFIFKTLDDIIKKRKMELTNNPQKLKSKHDLLTYLLTTNHEDKIPINDEVIRSILLDAFLAGFDTTSNLLCYIIYYICHNPNVKQKMFDEIDSVFPSDISHVTADILAKLKYCEAIIKETSRMMPVTAVSKRVAATECEVAGYIWPAKTVFHLNYASIHMNEKHWENPNDYDPDRFYLKNDFNEFENDFDVENKKSIHNMDKYSLVIFGGGIRICPGKKFAMINMLSFMALMFRKYDIELVDMQAPLNTCTTFITMCLDLKIKIKPRKS